MRAFFELYIHHNLPFWVLMTASIFLMVASLFIPPVGIIHSSVIAAVGELMGFGAIWTVAIAIEKGVDTKVKVKDTEITVGKNGNE